MREYQVKIGSRIVPVAMVSGVMDDWVWGKINAFKPFMDYIKRLEAEPRFSVEDIAIESVIFFGRDERTQRIGFMLVNTSITDENGNPLPGVAFLRGVSVVMLMIVRDGIGDEYAVLVQQPRTPIGQYGLLEMPAGTLDGANNFAGKAAEEIEQELGIKITAEDLIDLADLAFGKDCPGIYASPGASDEIFRPFVCIISMTNEEIDSLRGRLAGAAEEGETTIVNVMPLDSAWKHLPDAKSQMILGLYEKLKTKVERKKSKSGGGV